MMLVMSLFCCAKITFSVDARIHFFLNRLLSMVNYFSRARPNMIAFQENYEHLACGLASSTEIMTGPK